jgi:glucose/arabinose dehydrogenase/mono/diheme cytochrome c family protein
LIASETYQLLTSQIMNPLPNHAGKSLSLIFLLLLFAYACGPTPGAKVIEPDPGNGGILLPENFAAFVVADSLGRGRHIAVNANGDIYVHLRRPNQEKQHTIVGMRDTTGDGRADIIRGFSKVPGTGIEIHNGYLYYSSRTEVYRSPLQEGSLFPDNRIDTLIHLVDGGGHMEKPFTFDDKGNIYVNVGSESNACQEEKRTKHSPGVDPCIELETRAGIWRFSADALHQEQDIELRYATGIRNAVALTWNFKEDKLYALQHGRDDLHRFWPEYYTEEENLELPAEEFLDIEEGDDFGWPYCYWDQYQGKKMLSPEYGGNGKTQGRCEGIKAPLYGFPGHWAPNDLLFYQGDMFPKRYKEGAFIAWHGSWNRLGHQQAGFNVVFLPMKDGKPSGDYEIFADGFKGPAVVKSSGEAWHRPCGLAEGPDGSLYVVDSQIGRVWRIMYYPEGTPVSGGPGDLLADHQQYRVPKATETEDLPEALVPGKQVYDSYCLPCHMENGKGAPGMNPPLVGTDWVLGSKDRTIKVLLQGLSGAVEINGDIYQNAMPSHAFLTDKQIADVLTFVRQSWGNEASPVLPEEVQKVRRGLPAN